jgi:hypothetical protein
MMGPRKEHAKGRDMPLKKEVEHPGAAVMAPELAGTDDSAAIDSKSASPTEHDDPPYRTCELFLERPISNPLKEEEMFVRRHKAAVKAAANRHRLPGSEAAAFSFSRIKWRDADSVKAQGAGLHCRSVPKDEPPKHASNFHTLDTSHEGNDSEQQTESVNSRNKLPGAPGLRDLGQDISLHAPVHLNRPP